jgi:protein tyrosine/serine phosphatase
VSATAGGDHRLKAGAMGTTPRPAAPGYSHPVVADRHLNWDGCYNVRDLGGLPAANGRHTRWGAIVRADTPDQLTPSGWAALQAHGIRTIVDLRNHEERPAPTSPGDPGLSTVHLPLDDVADTQFWQYCRDNGLDATPLYFLPFLQHKPERCAAAIAAIANAQPGGVLVHCRIGRDRTGLVALLLLALVGVAPDHIADDYELRGPRMTSLSDSCCGGRPGR